MTVLRFPDRWFDDKSTLPVTCFVGEMPGGIADDGRPAFEDGYSARRLASLMGCRDLDEFREKYFRVNLFYRRRPWDQYDATESAKTLLEMTGRAATLILCGRRVASSFMIGPSRDHPVWTLEERTELFEAFCCRPGLILIRMPHPSGLNRWWNDPYNVDLAMRELRLWRR